MRSTTWKGLWTASWLAVATWAQAQEPAPQALFEQARPNVEAVLGRPLEKPLRLRAVTTAELAAVPDPELAAQVVWQFPDLHRNRFLGTAFKTAKEVVRSATPILIDPRTGELLWQADAAKQIATWNPATGQASTPAFVQLAIVHAVICRQLDQQYNLGRRWQQCRDAEEFQILQTVRAGRAFWLTRQVARQLGTEAQVPLLLQALHYTPDPEGDNALRLVARETLRRKYSVAADGLRFCEYLEDQKWPHLEKTLFDQPPRQLAWLNRPELYAKAQQSARQGLAETLRRLAPPAPAEGWKAAEQPWTPAMVRQVASLLGQGGQADKVLRSWDEARTQLWVHQSDAGKQVAVSVVRFENEAGARAYYGFANDLQRKRDEVGNAPDAGLLRVLDSRTAGCPLRAAAEAVRFEKVLQGETQTVSEKKVLARAGDTVIELAWYGTPDDPAWTEQVVAELLKK